MIPKSFPRAALPIALVLLVAILLAPVWQVAYPPLMDYPNHLASSFVLAHLQDPRFKFSEIYQANWRPYPYVAMDVMLIGLQQLVPVESAGRIFVSLCLLSLPLATWFFIRHANPGHELLALWSLPLAYNEFFYLGYLSYYLSIAVCFVVLGLWMVYLARPTRRSWAHLAIMITLLYFVHFVGFAIAAFVVTVQGVFKRRSLSQLVSVWLAFLPGVIMGLILLAEPGGITHNITFQGFQAKAAAVPAVLHYSRKALLITFVVLLAAASWRNRDFRWNQDWLVVLAALLALYLVLPAYYGGPEIDIRVIPFLCIVVLAAAGAGSRVRWLACAAILSFLLQRGPMHEFVAVQPHLAALARSFGTIPANARVLPMVEGDYRSFYYPYSHFWAYGVMRKGWLVLDLFTTQPSRPLYRHDKSYYPQRVGLRFEEPPDWMRLRSSFDYVWAYNVQRFATRLDQIGELVFAQDDLKVYRMDKPVFPPALSSPNKSSPGSGSAR